MVLDFSIEKCSVPITHDPKSQYELFQINVDGTDSIRRMLTVVTKPDSTVAGKWFSEVLRGKTCNASPPLNGFQADSIFVGLVAEEDLANACLDNRVKAQARPLNMLSISVGGDCLMLAMDVSGHLSKAVREFLNHPRVVVFGTDMSQLVNRLQTIHDVTIKSGVDLNQLAVASFDRSGSLRP